MLPVIKSDYWSKEDEPLRQAQTPRVTYAPVPQHAVPLIYSKAPVTIHHAPHSTFNSNPHPDTYLPLLDRMQPLPPPPMYEPMAPDRVSEYTTVYDKPALEEIPASNQKSAGEIVKAKIKMPLWRKVLKPAKVRQEKNKKDNSIIELTPLSKASAIIDTFEEIEDGLADSLQKKHSAPTKNLLRCCQMSVRTVKRLLIALVALSAVYTAGTQIYDHSAWLEKFTFGSLFPSNRSIATEKPPNVLFRNNTGAGVGSLYSDSNLIFGNGSAPDLDPPTVTSVRTKVRPTVIVPLYIVQKTSDDPTVTQTADDMATKVNNAFEVNSGAAVDNTDAATETNAKPIVTPDDTKSDTVADPPVEENVQGTETDTADSVVTTKTTTSDLETTAVDA